MARQGADHAEVGGVARVPAADRAVAQRSLGARHLGRVEEGLRAQAVAFRAGADRAVEGEQARLQLVQAVAAVRAGVLAGERDQVRVRRVHRRHAGHALAEAQRGLEGLGQPGTQPRAHRQPVDHHLDGVLAAQVQPQRLVELAHRAVDARAQEALGAQRLQQLLVLALALAQHRRDQQDAPPRRQRQHVVGHLGDGLRPQLLAVARAARRAGARVQQPQVVVDLGDGAHRRARVVRGALLLDGDRRRQALDAVHVGFLHARQELPGVGRQGFHVAPLALGEQGVEGQRGLAGARQAGEHRQAVARQVEAEVGEVVGARAADSDLLHGGAGRASNLLLYDVL